MSSFIFNFKNEAKVIAAVLLALLVCELALRHWETALSLDLKHIRSLPTIAADLHASEGTRILLLGNSLTRSGTDKQILTSELEHRGLGKISVERAHPDGSNIEEWFYTLKTFFVEPHLLPDLLVVITGRAHLQDQSSDPSTIGAYYSSGNGLSDFLFSGKHSIEQRAEFLAGHYSTAYANRRRIEPRLFSVVIPHYQTSVQQINDERMQRAALAIKTNSPTYFRLEQFLELAEQKSVKVVFATIPMHEPYGLDTKIRQRIEAYGQTLIEMHQIEGINSSRFPDAYHLDQTGAEIYSRALAQKLAEVWRPFKISEPKN